MALLMERHSFSAECYKHAAPLEQSIKYKAKSKTQDQRPKIQEQSSIHETSFAKPKDGPPICG
jgi:hypothetical protein